MRRARPGVSTVIGLLLVACGAPGCVSGPPTANAPHAALWEEIAPEFLPALESLEAAVLEGDDVAARAILRRLQARGPTGPALEMSQAFERILDGRDVVRTLEMRLEAHADPDAPGRYNLELVLAQPGTEVLELHPGPARLVRSLILVQGDGDERRSVSERSIPIRERWIVRPGEETRVDLGPETLPAVSGALAVRCRWEVAFLSGELHVGERALPAMRLVTTPAKRVLLADFLPTEPVPHTELVRYALEGRVHRAPALERAVRMPPSAYSAALDGLADEVGLIHRVALDELLPALRWLAGDEAPMGGADAWRRWLELRASERRGGASTLDMPSASR